MMWQAKSKGGNFEFFKIQNFTTYFNLYLICFLVITKSINKTMFKLEFWIISRLSKGPKIYRVYMFWFLLSYWDESLNCLWEKEIMHEGPMVVKGLSNKIRDGGHQTHQKKKRKEKKTICAISYFLVSSKSSLLQK